MTPSFSWISSPNLRKSKRSACPSALISSTEGRAEATGARHLCPGYCHQYEHRKKIGVNWGVTENGIIHFTLWDLRQSTASDILAWVRGAGGGVSWCLEKTHLHYGDCRSMTGIGICRLQKFWGACAQVRRYWSNTRQLPKHIPTIYAFPGVLFLAV